VPQIAAFPKANGSRQRNVVFTQGKDATVVANHGRVSFPFSGTGVALCC